MGIHKTSIMLSTILLITFLTPIMGMQTSNGTRSCPTCLLVKGSQTAQSSAPWLFNNDNAKFRFLRTDGEGKPAYVYIATNNIYYIHYYDEGFFYDGFYVVNDSETGYVEGDGRAFAYNSGNNDCPQNTG